MYSNTVESTQVSSYGKIAYEIQLFQDTTIKTAIRMWCDPISSRAINLQPKIVWTVN